MDLSDKKILENELSVAVAKAVCQWSKKNGILCPVHVTATQMSPSCFVDEQCVSHSGPLVVCDVDIIDDDDYFDEED